MSYRELPVPPDEIALYVGGTKGTEFVEQGRRLYRCLLHCLPPGFSFEGKKVLDFGCGSGRILRHFAETAERCEFWGSDISKPCIDWLSAHYQPPFRLVQNKQTPPLPFQNGYFDLVYAISVFTHIADTWKIWLQELKRVMKPGAIALLSFMGSNVHQSILGEPFDEAIGMKVSWPDHGWESGGPFVYHSNEWITRNWGKVLSIEAIFFEGLDRFQSIALVRKIKRKKTSGSPLVIRPFSYREVRHDFKGDLILGSFTGQSWLANPGIPVPPIPTFEGWFTSRRGHIDRVEVRINGDLIAAEGKINLEREDVQKALPDFPHSLHSGFKLTVDLSKFSSGPLNLEITGIDSVGNCLPISAWIRVVGWTDIILDPAEKNWSSSLSSLSMTRVSGTDSQRTIHSKMPGYRAVRSFPHIYPPDVHMQTRKESLAHIHSKVMQVGIRILRIHGF
jgi:SAM-dependent methyltransferase